MVKRFGVFPVVLFNGRGSQVLIYVPIRNIMTNFCCIQRDFCPLPPTGPCQKNFHSEILSNYEGVPMSIRRFFSANVVRRVMRGRPLFTNIRGLFGPFRRDLCLARDMILWEVRFSMFNFSWTSVRQGRSRRPFCCIW